MRPSTDRLRLLCYAAAVTGAALALVFKGVDTYACLRPPGTVSEFLRMDLSLDWLSAKSFWAGQRVYEPLRGAMDFQFGPTLTASAKPISSYDTHPPGAVLFALPMGWLDYQEAFAVWTALSLAAFVAGIVVLALALENHPWLYWALTVVFIVCSYPFQESLALGQLNCFLFLLLAVALWADCRRRWWLLGTAVALATSLKLFPGLLFVTLCFQRKYRALGAGLAAMAAIGLLGLLVLGYDANHDYLMHVVPSLAQENKAAMNNQSLQDLWSKLFNPGRETVIPLVQSVQLERVAQGATWLLALLVLWRVGSKQPAVTRLGSLVPLTISLMTLLSPVTWNHYFLLLTIPVMWLLQRVPFRSWDFWLLLVCTGVLCLPYWTVWRVTLPSRVFSSSGLGTLDWVDVVAGVAIHLYAAIGIAVLLVRDCYKTISANPQPKPG